MIGLLAGLFAVTAAVGIALLVGFAPRPAPAAPMGSVGLRAAGARAAESTRLALRRRGFALADPDQLELAGIRSQPATVLLTVALIVIGAGAFGVGLAIARPGLLSFLIPLIFVAAAAIGVRLWFERRVSGRRERFAEQLDDTLQLIASGLRAGHSLPRAIEAVSSESESPTREEFARVVNEHRLGRDLDEALLLAAERMRSPDLEWTAEAVGVHREVGGNLGEVLDHVAETIRERQQIRRQVASLSAEGRVSALVLIALPFFVALVLAFVSPGYLSMFVTTPIGLGLGLVSILLFVVGALWLRAITKVSF